MWHRREWRPRPTRALRTTADSEASIAPSTASAEPVDRSALLRRAPAQPLSVVDIRGRPDCEPCRAVCSRRAGCLVCSVLCTVNSVESTVGGRGRGFRRGSTAVRRGAGAVCPRLRLSVGRPFSPRHASALARRAPRVGLSKNRTEHATYENESRVVSSGASSPVRASRRSIYLSIHRTHGDISQRPVLCLVSVRMLRQQWRPHTRTDAYIYRHSSSRHSSRGPECTGEARSLAWITSC